MTTVPMVLTHRASMQCFQRTFPGALKAPLVSTGLGAHRGTGWPKRGCLPAKIGLQPPRSWPFNQKREASFLGQDVKQICQSGTWSALLEFEHNEPGIIQKNFAAIFDLACVNDNLTLVTCLILYLINTQQKLTADCVESSLCMVERMFLKSCQIMRFVQPEFPDTGIDKPAVKVSSPHAAVSFVLNKLLKALESADENVQKTYRATIDQWLKEVDCSIRFVKNCTELLEDYVFANDLFCGKYSAEVKSFLMYVEKVENEGIKWTVDVDCRGAKISFSIKSNFSFSGKNESKEVFNSLKKILRPKSEEALLEKFKQLKRH